jgi:hypothetical protein
MVEGLTHYFVLAVLEESMEANIANQLHQSELSY